MPIKFFAQMTLRICLQIGMSFRHHGIWIRKCPRELGTILASKMDFGLIVSFILEKILKVVTVGITGGGGSYRFNIF